MIPLHSKKSQSVFWLFSALVFNDIIQGDAGKGGGSVSGQARATHR